jgi:cytochrome P450
MLSVIAFFIADPYFFYDQLRATCPVYPLTPGAWLVTRYGDADRVLRDLGEIKGAPVLQITEILTEEHLFLPSPNRDRDKNSSRPF